MTIDEVGDIEIPILNHHYRFCYMMRLSEIESIYDDGKKLLERKISYAELKETKINNIHLLLLLFLMQGYEAGIIPLCVLPNINLSVRLVGRPLGALQRGHGKASWHYN